MRIGVEAESLIVLNLEFDAITYRVQRRYWKGGTMRSFSNFT